MKKTTRFAASLMAVAMIAGTPLMVQAHAQQQPSMTSTQPNNPEAQAAYDDGVKAAQLDKAANRPISAESSHLYKHPPVKKEKQDAYRDAFKKGYEAQVKQSGL